MHTRADILLLTQTVFYTPIQLYHALGIMDGGGGSQRLRARVLTAQPTAHVFGHVHSSFGIQTLGRTTFANCASVDNFYAVTHPIVVLDIPLVVKLPVFN